MASGNGIGTPSIHEALVASATESLVAISPEGEVLSWNAAARGRFGIGAEQAVGKELHALYRLNGFVPSTDQGIRNAILQAREMGSCRVVTASQKPDGLMAYSEVTM